MVAIKVLTRRIDSAADGTGLLGELRALGRLAEHPNVIPVFEAGTTSEGQPFFVMPLYREGTLAERVLQVGRLDIESILRIGVKLAGALETAHQASIVHGDVKPDNVLLTRYGDVVLADFGLARIVRSDYLGPLPEAFTLMYAAPEVLEGSPTDPAADIYALAASLYTCARGAPPFAPLGNLNDVIVAKLQSAPPLLDDESLSEILLTALAPDPAVRPSAEEFGRRLQNLQQERGFPITELIVVHDLGSLAAADESSSGRESTSLDGVVLPDEMVGSVGRHGSIATGEHSQRRAGSRDYGDTVPPPPLSRPRNERSEVFRQISAGLRAVLSFVRTAWREMQPVTLRTSRVAPTLDSLSSDRPTALDLLGYEPLSEGLARLLNDPGTALPITIGITGRWGSGKSSLMLQLQERLSDPPDPQPSHRRWLCIWFDAWRFQGREAFWAGLARTVYQQAQRQMPTSQQRLLFRLRLERSRRGAWRFLGALAVLSGGALFCVGSAARALFAGPGWSAAAGIAAGFGALGVAASYLGVISAPFERAISKGSLTKRYDEFLGISDEAERDVQHLLSSLTSLDDQTAVLVFLDDLDRCHPGVIAEALASITELYGRREGDRIGFVLGVDMDVVLGSVDMYLSDVRESMVRLNPRRASDLSMHYLEKIFQLTVAIDHMPHLPVQRLFVGGGGAGENPKEDEAVAAALMTALRELRISNPAQVTMLRREAGILSDRLEEPSLLALRSAVRDRRAELLTRASSDVRNAEEAVIRVLALTPRAAKRFDNAFRLQLQVANGTPGSQLGFDVAQLTGMAKWVAFRLFFSSVSRLSDRHPGLLGELEQVASDPNGSLELRTRITEVLPNADGEMVAELGALLRVGYPASSLASLSLDTFPNIV